MTTYTSAAVSPGEMAILRIYGHLLAVHESHNCDQQACLSSCKGKLSLLTYPLYLGLAHEESGLTVLCCCLDLQKVLRGLVSPELLVDIVTSSEIACQYAVDVVIDNVRCFGPFIALHIAIFLVYTNIFSNLTPPIRTGESGQKIQQELKSLEKVSLNVI